MIRKTIGVVIASLLGATLSFPQAASCANPTNSYAVIQTYQVGGEGAWDYLTVDPERKLLYVPRTTHTLVLEADTGKTIADMPGQTGNHGVALVPKAKRGFITDGKGAAIFVFDLGSHEILGKLKAVPDADGIIYDHHSDQVLFVSGDEGVLIPIAPAVDPKAGTVGTPVSLGGKPEFLASDENGRVFINLVDKDQVAVVDTNSMKVLAHWPVAPGGSPVGMSIDRGHHRLFIGCRKPQKMIVMSTEDGKVLADIPIGPGVDATQFDDGSALASCADGTLAVVRETAPDKFELVQTVNTAPAARTMGLDPTAHMLYLPTAEMQPPPTGQGRATPKPGTFKIIVVKKDAP